MKTIFYRTDVYHILLWALVVIMVLVSTVYFTSCYLTNGELIFDKEDAGIFFSFQLSVITLIIMNFFMMTKIIRVESLIQKVAEISIEMEDNLSNNQRDTQSMILDLFKRFGVGKLEKKDRLT